MGKTKIQWADNVWNPVTGCTPVSIGCANCYARRMANRLRGRYGYPANEPFRVTLHPERLDEPLHWREPRMVFVVSMGDLFHEDVPDAFIDKIWTRIAYSPNSTFIILTKRVERMEKWIYDHRIYYPILNNLWLGVSIENQEMAELRIPILLQIFPVSKRIVSIEPMLGPVDLSAWLGISRYEEGMPYARETGADLDWVICGAETGPRARPMKREWAESLLDQCQSVRVPFFYKQGPDDNGNFTEMPILRGKTWDEIPY